MSTKSVRWVQGQPCSLLARLTARLASGAWTGIAGEGKWLTQADVESMQREVYDLSAEDPETPLHTEAVDPEEVLLDTPATDRESWTADRIGYNFVADVSGGLFDTANRRLAVVYRVELIETIGGGTFSFAFVGTVQPLLPAGI